MHRIPDFQYKLKEPSERALFGHGVHQWRRPSAPGRRGWGWARPPPRAGAVVLEEEEEDDDDGAAAPAREFRGAGEVQQDVRSRYVINRSIASRSTTLHLHVTTTYMYYYMDMAVVGDEILQALGRVHRSGRRQLTSRTSLTTSPSRLSLHSLRLPCSLPSGLVAVPFHSTAFPLTLQMFFFTKILLI